jgi:hypothetical protein
MKKSKLLKKAKGNSPEGEASVIMEYNKLAARGILAHIEEATRLDDHKIVYLSLPYSSNYRMMKQVCESFLLETMKTEIEYDKYYIIAQPRVMHYIFNDLAKMISKYDNRKSIGRVLGSGTNRQLLAYVKLLNQKNPP